MELHGFGDASDEAYGTVLYVRCETGDGTTSVNFVAGKVKVATVKPLTIPRLELLSALITYRLSLHHLKILREQFPSLSIRATHWSEAQVTLYRICARKSRYHPFVSNRVGKILEESTAVQWRYVPTLKNPADDVSRGLKASQMYSDHRWFRGPGLFTRSGGRLASEHRYAGALTRRSTNENAEIHQCSRSFRTTSDK